MKGFLDALLLIYKKNEKNIKEDDINIFQIMFKGNEEVTLHSRFISYLLSKERKFLKLFCEVVLNLTEEEFDIDNCEILPNEYNKSEYQEIDILIINHTKKQAIIIENKIDAHDSIHYDMCKESGYRGQLERYFHTIILGQDKKGNQCQFKCDFDKTKVYYLSLYKKPSIETIGKLSANELNIFNPERHCIDYYGIQEWLSHCLQCMSDGFLKEVIGQYLNLIKNMTTDNEQALLITNLLAENKDYCLSSYMFSRYFKDVKWHTIHRFFAELSEKFQTEMPDEKLISDVAHNNKKVVLKIEFGYKDTKLQIVNDDKGFTLGNLTPTREVWGYFNSGKIRNIRFCDFSNEETFRVINNDYRKEIIEAIEKEILDHDEENYQKLNNFFTTYSDVEKV